MGKYEWFTDLVKCVLCDKVIEPGPDRTVGPKNPWTVQIHGLFKVRNRSMRKKHGTVRTAIRPSVLWTVTGSDGFDSFSLKRRRPDSFFFFSPKRRRSETAPTFFFPLLYGVVLPLSKSLFWNPLFSFLNHSQPSLVSASLKSSHSQVSISPSRRRTSHFAAQPLRHSLVALRSSASLPRRCRSVA